MRIATALLLTGCATGTWSEQAEPVTGSTVVPSTERALMEAEVFVPAAFWRAIDRRPLQPTYMLEAVYLTFSISNLRYADDDTLIEAGHWTRSDRQLRVNDEEMDLAFLTADQLQDSCPAAKTAGCAVHISEIVDVGNLGGDVAFDWTFSASASGYGRPPRAEIEVLSASASIE